MKKVMILGMHNTWKEAPTDFDGDVWAMNTSWMIDGFLERLKITHWWEMHTLETRSEAHLDWLVNHCHYPVFMQYRQANIEYSIEYPLEEVLNRYRRYYLCTMAFQLSYAILQGYEEIHMYGFNMMFTDDLIQKWSMEYWLGFAEGKGIEVFIPDGCDLLYSPKLYGYEAVNTLGVYMQRYMNRIERENLIKLQGMLLDMKQVYENVRLLSCDRTKFMYEIFNRHGIDPDTKSDWGDY